MTDASCPCNDTFPFFVGQKEMEFFHILRLTVQLLVVDASRSYQRKQNPVCLSAIIGISLQTSRPLYRRRVLFAILYIFTEIVNRYSTSKY